MTMCWNSLEKYIRTIMIQWNFPHTLLCVLTHFTWACWEWQRSSQHGSLNGKVEQKCSLLPAHTYISLGWKTAPQTSNFSNHQKHLKDFFKHGLLALSTRVSASGDLESGSRIFFSNSFHNLGSTILDYGVERNKCPFFFFWSSIPFSVYC